jgi:hypothetical protein
MKILSASTLLDSIMLGGILLIVGQELVPPVEDDELELELELEPVEHVFP